jgi:hypothetical protein
MIQTFLGISHDFTVLCDAVFCQIFRRISLVLAAFRRATLVIEAEIGIEYRSI